MAEETIKEIYDSMTEKQKMVVHFMIGEAIKDTLNKISLPLERPYSRAIDQLVSDIIKGE